MNSIIPDEIQDISVQDLPAKITTIYEYMKYMKEQIEFWGSNRSREITELQNQINTLSDQIAELTGE